MCAKHTWKRRRLVPVLLIHTPILNTQSLWGIYSEVFFLLQNIGDTGSPVLDFFVLFKSEFCDLGGALRAHYTRKKALFEDVPTSHANRRKVRTKLGLRTDLLCAHFALSWASTGPNVGSP